MRLGSDVAVELAHSFVMITLMVSIKNLVGLGGGPYRAATVWKRIFSGKPENVFLALYSVFGIMFMVVIPPMQVADENAHFYRAYQVSEGVLVSEHTALGAGGVLPSGVVDFVNSADTRAVQPGVTQKFNPHQRYPALWNIRTSSSREPVAFDNTAIYAPTNYLVPALGIDAAKILTNRPVIHFYAARLANLIFLGAMVYAAIKLMPRGKWALAVIGLMPMVLYEAISVSADVYIIGLLAVFTACWYKIYSQKKSPFGSDWAALAATSLLIAFSKPSYVLFVLVLVLLVVPVWRDKRELFKRAMAVSAIGLAALLIAAGWFYSTKSLNADFVQWAASFGTMVDPNSQTAFIKGHPFDFLAALANTLATNNGNGLVTSFLGNFGWLDTPLPEAISIVLVVVFLLALGKDQLSAKAKIYLSKYATFFMLGLGLLCVIVLAIGIYTYWNPVGGSLIFGFQGRYFIPIVIFLLPCLVGRYTHSIRMRSVLFVLAAALVSTIVVLAYRYYALPSFV
jgi:uncharacterized membrane protein